MSRPRHPNKHIELAVQYAESLGWRVEMSKGHAGAILMSPKHAGRLHCWRVVNPQNRDIMPATSGGT